MNLEHELRNALRRKDPAAGFEERVRARIAANARLRPAPVRSGPAVRLLPLAASLLLALGTGYYLHERNERSRIDQQQRDNAHDVALALRIASEKTLEIRHKVQEITRHEP